MSVSLLLCEGGPTSADSRVLARVLAGRALIEPSGGKYGMGDRIKGRRLDLKQQSVFGLLDGDFDPNWTHPTSQPQPWIGSDQSVLGWRWERKEIENYLLDPEIVRRSLAAAAPPADDYRDLLHRSRDQIAIYQAARLALTVHRPRFKSLSNQFGRKRGSLQHVMPDNCSLEACLAGLQTSVGEHNREQGVSDQAVEVEFQRRRKEYEVGGSRYSHFLCTFAGKDLLCSMAEGLPAIGFPSAAVFLEKVLVGIDNTVEDVGDWLDEWAALRDLVDAA